MSLEDFIILGKLTPTELKRLRKDASAYSTNTESAQVQSVSYKGLDLNFRKSEVFFPKPQNNIHSFNIVQSIIIQNYCEVTKNIPLHCLAEVQYARYTKGCFFAKHRDCIKSETPRVLTCSINISDKTSYNGGELVIYDDNHTTIAELPKEPGSFIIFPSIFIHEAKEVTEGTRESIVSWIHASNTIFNIFKHEIYNG